MSEPRIKDARTAIAFLRVVADSGERLSEQDNRELDAILAEPRVMPRDVLRRERLEVIEAVRQFVAGDPLGGGRERTLSFLDGIEFVERQPALAAVPSESDAGLDAQEPTPYDKPVVALQEAIDAVAAYGAEPPEYPGLVLVPKADIEALRAAKRRIDALG